MNTDTGGIYDDYRSAMLDADEGERVIEVEGEPDAVADAAEALEQRAKALGKHRPGDIPSARALRRELERRDG